MNKMKVVSMIIVLLTTIISTTVVNVENVSAKPDYLGSLRAIYGSGIGSGSCMDCHIGSGNSGKFTDYGILFENQNNHVSDPKAALEAIGAPPRSSKGNVNRVPSPNIGIGIGNTDMQERPTPPSAPATPRPQKYGYISVTTSPVSGSILMDGNYQGIGSVNGPSDAGLSITVSFGDVAGYITPSPQSVYINEGQTVHVTGMYIVKLYSFDNIPVDHTIKLCDVVSDNERAVTGGSMAKNCGKTVFTLNDHPLDMLPSGGSSGKVSDSEMVYVDIVTGGSMSILPWRTQTVIISWYDGSDNRLMYNATAEVNNIDNYAGAFIGHFSWEINKPGKYYVDVNVVNWGTERVVFDVVDNGGPSPVVTYEIQTPSHIVTPVVTRTPSPVITYIATPAPRIATPAPIPTPVQANNPDPGCWSSAMGFGMCVGDVGTRTVVGIVLGVGKGIFKTIG